MASQLTHFRTPADPHPAQQFSISTQRLSAKQFLAYADWLVDVINEARVRNGATPLSAEQVEALKAQQITQFLKMKYPVPAELRRNRVKIGPPERFKREPDIFLPLVRFGRTRLFLSRLIGDVAWRGWTAA